MGTSPGFIRGQTPSAAQWNDYFAQKADDYLLSRIIPTTGQTYATPISVGTLILDPIGPIATLTITAPAAARDQQKFMISTTQVIGALTVQPAVGQNLLGGELETMSANSGAAWQYLLATTTWYRIQ